MNLSFFKANASYCDYLREADKKVPYTMDQKSLRPFVGILVEINNINYYAPLTSPKPKHLTMKNQIDFIKINGGTWGAINLNNMIPIHASSLSKIEIAPLESDSPADRTYKNLLSNQLSWCNTNKNQIMAKALKLYETVNHQQGWSQLTQRCCNFQILEQRYIDYCHENNLLAPEKSLNKPPLVTTSNIASIDASIPIKTSIKDRLSDAKQKTADKQPSNNAPAPQVTKKITNDER